MLIPPGALQPVPAFAVVPEDAIIAVLKRVTADAAVEPRLQAAFRTLELEHPALASFVGSELSELEDASAQALAYFLFLAVFMAFREAFGDRLAEVAQSDLDAVLDRLIVDSEVRGAACQAHSYSEDAIALGQPALMRLVHSELRDGDPDAADAEPMLQALLVQIVALTHAVTH
jgi:hypothetical protein